MRNERRRHFYVLLLTLALVALGLRLTGNSTPKVDLPEPRATLNPPIQTPHPTPSKAPTTEHQNVSEAPPYPGVYMGLYGVTWTPPNLEAVPLTCQGATPGLSREEVDQLSPKGIQVTFDRGWVRHVTGRELCLGKSTVLQSGASSDSALKVLGEPDSRHNYHRGSLPLQSWSFGGSLLVLHFEVNQKRDDNLKLLEVRLNSKLSIETINPDKSEWEIVSY